MPRGKRTNTSAIDTPAKRARIAPSEDATGPTWERIRRGLHVGYFKPRSGAGAWWLRVAARGRYVKKAFAIADDPGGEAAAVARALPLLDHAAAVERAQGLAKSAPAEARRRRSMAADPSEGEPDSGGMIPYRYPTATARTYTVADMLRDHARALAAEGKTTSARAVESAAGSALFAAIADLRVAEVRGADLIAWRDELAASAPLRRARGGARLRRLPREADAEAHRRRRVRVNRLITDLKAARNRLAKRVDWLPPESAAEFTKLERFADVGRGKVRPLDAEEVGRLLDACSTPEFRDLVLGALLTGGRFAEVAALRVTDFRARDGKLHFAKTKDEPEAGRDVALSAEGVELFRRLTDGRSPGAPIFRRPDGAAWSKSDQFRPMRDAVARAGLSSHPSRPTFHSLRDTFASTLLRSGVRLEVVSKLLGHSSVVVTERHYARFAESDLDSAARSLPRFARVPATVATIAERGRRHR